MNLLFLAVSYYISILDGRADEFVLDKGWELSSFHYSRRANMVGFDHETSIKRNLPLVSAITDLDLPNRLSVLFFKNESIHKESSNHSLLLECRLKKII
jgi:hypothetical protein